MAFANFSLTTAYTAIITALNTQLTAVAGMFKDQTTGDFVGQIRVSSTGKRLESWSGSAWVALDLSSTAITTATNSTNATTAANATTHIADVAGAVHGAVPTNTADMIVRRDASGNFSAGTMTGTATTATNALSLGGSLAALFAKLASPALTGTPTAPTAAAGTNTTQLATTEYATAAVAAAKVNTALTGVPTAPTATAGTNTTQLATTQFVASAGALKANLDSPTFTGTPVMPTGTTGITQPAEEGSTKLATTMHVSNKMNAYSFGLSQSWQDVTASRILATNYTNNSGRPIHVSITVRMVAGQGLKLLTDGGAAAYISGNAGIEIYQQIALVIPNLQNYQLSYFAGSGSVIVAWYELR